MTALPIQSPAVPPLHQGRKAAAGAVVRGARGAAVIAGVRDLGPADGHLIERLYEQLGPQSRYQRFHGPKPRLTAADVAFLAGADGRDHVALVALDGDGGPLGVARFVRLQDPATADI